MTLGVPGGKGQASPGDTGLLWGRHLVSAPKANIQTSKCKDRESENGASCPSSRPEEQTQQKHLPLLQVFQLPLKAGKTFTCQKCFSVSLFPWAQGTYNDLHW